MKPMKPTQRNRKTGQYTLTRFDYVCVCGHKLGLHSAERVGDLQECFVEDCRCESFRKSGKNFHESENCS
jgi:hypothetical protein